MRVHEEQLGDITVLTPHGDLDATALPAFEARVARIVAAGARILIWDLLDVGMLPSTGVGFLIHAGKRMRASGGRMVLAGMQARVRGTLQTMGVAELFPTYVSRAAAVAALG